jgi:hypothetical protein
VVAIAATNDHIEPMITKGATTMKTILVDGVKQPAPDEYERLMNARWPAHAVPGVRQGLTETDEALLAQLQRRPYALNKRERDQLIKLQRKTK